MLFAPALGLVQAGCGADVCEGQDAPEVFSPVAADLPGEMVFCVVSGGDGLPLRNQARVNFDAESTEAAKTLLIEHLVGSGWKRGETPGAELAFSRSDGSVLEFGSFSNPQSQTFLKQDRLHAIVTMKSLVCASRRGRVCLDESKVADCRDGLVAEETACAERTCVEGRDAKSKRPTAACVSDVCLAGHSASGKWAPDNCPEVFTGVTGS